MLARSCYDQVNMLLNQLVPSRDINLAGETKEPSATTEKVPKLAPGYV